MVPNMQGLRGEQRRGWVVGTRIRSTCTGCDQPCCQACGGSPPPGVGACSTCDPSTVQPGHAVFGLPTLAHAPGHAGVVRGLSDTCSHCVVCLHNLCRAVLRSKTSLRQDGIGGLTCTLPPSFPVPMPWHPCSHATSIGCFAFMFLVCEYGTHPMSLCPSQWPSGLMQKLANTRRPPGASSDALQKKRGTRHC